MSKILGIDLGTTNSAIAIVEGGEAKIIENKEGNRTTPSIVAISKNGDRLAGLLAKRQAVTNPQNTIFSAKRLIGRRYSDPEVQRDKKLLSYEIREASNGGVEIKMNDKWYTPQQISSMVLQKLKADAEEKLGEKIEEAIITVPAYFDDSQRQATKDAGEIAGLKVNRIINEPTAAALAYGLDKKKEEKIVVYDFGGGTFDVSVLEVSADTIEVRGTGGDTHLGGDDFDQKIIRWLIDEFKKDQGIDLSKDVLALQRLKEGAERAKHELSSTIETEINIPFITSGADGPKHFNLKMTRAKLEELVRDEIERSVKETEKVVKEAGFQLTEIDEIVLVGGQTRMPAIQEVVKKLFNKEPHKGINPDEVVALGAAIQGGIMQGSVRDVLLLDVTPLSLGIETLGGVCTKIIEKNITIPVSRSQVFSTAADNQPSVEIHILQGEREMAGDNKTLGRFILDGIPPSPRGVPQVEVTFDIDANGILNVKAKDKATNKEQSVRIESSSGLSKEEIEKMKQEAAVHADEDKKKKEAVELKNNAENLIYSTEKTLRDFGDKVSADEKKIMEEKIEALKKIKEGQDIEAIKKAIEDLSREAQKIGEAMYKAQGEANPPAGGEEGPASAKASAGEEREAKEGEVKEGKIEE
ncbi:MAG: Chaperone protein DnaK [Parcubacteria group bacterium GW2011_GWD2_38_12]|nr:MAG: Chaperone protein DnaK [Parcubacteria group bacterium GW2011_GWC2_36_17]KKQ43709.1 MAG: Chaperone protein DnaK [Parcubacteria group bacterium GW2011_GWE2_37_8]KKQ52642.1 MAG: Chaperone protein DnaK [Parcubacteria group bacterium GW2011_GWD2_38_12]KKQ58839.1 MAG: Chaperone protein DnaK [Parcubacteria group bacterium GW2011_GWC1_38_17]KKQ59595.1 MAG: Chaperone protein DnaK [Parcubacteria group bacterium GW2011_GWD1_38_16]